MPEIEQKAPATSSAEKYKRRGFLLGAAGIGLAVWYGWPMVQRVLPQRFDFVWLDNPSGFRKLTIGNVSGAGNALAGIDRERDPALDNMIAKARAQLCTSLYGPDDPAAGVVPIVSFSDYNCVYCRVVTEILSEMQDDPSSGTRIVWREWPMLGPESVVQAKAALAAGNQDAYMAFHHTLMGSRFVPNIDYLANLATDKGLSARKLLADMNSPPVLSHIQESRALASIFGFRGTPSMIVGRTAVSGNISRGKLEALIERERQEGPILACV